MLPNLPSPQRWGSGEETPPERKGNKNAVPPAVRLTRARRYCRPPRRLWGGFGLGDGHGGEEGRRGEEVASPTVTAHRLGSRQHTQKAAGSQGEPPLIPRVGGSGWRWSSLGAGSDSRPGTSRRAGRGEVFLAMAMSQRVFAKPGEPQHVGERVPSPQRARPWLGAALRWREKRGEGAGGAALPAGSTAGPAASPGAGN